MDGDVFSLISLSNHIHYAAQILMRENIDKLALKNWQIKYW